MSPSRAQKLKYGRSFIRLGGGGGGCLRSILRDYKVCVCVCVCARACAGGGGGGGGGTDCEAQRLPPLPSGRQTKTSRPLTKQSSDNGEALAILVLIQRSTWRFQCFFKK